MKIIEVTMSVPNAPKLIKELKEEFKDACVGAGTVLTKDAVDACIENNADFIVAPCLDEEVVAYAIQRKALIIPGLMTMSEINKAYKLGLRFIKIFPDLSIMPTGGVNKDNIDEWIKGGADCSGIGSDLNKVYKSNGSEGVKEYCAEVISKVKSL